jgi:TolB-like protein
MDRLDSWKEIATYLSRSVRTVRRWEKHEGLPVHRQMHTSLGSVYAYRSELDQWRRKNEGTLRRQTKTPEASAKHASTPSVAVLPFDYLGPDRAHEYLADGLTEEVISHLSGIEKIRVISRTSSMALKGTNRNVRSIGAELGVEYLVEGSVRRDGKRLRVSARLIEVESDDRRWSEHFDGTLPDVFEIQERLARKIVESLEVQLTREENLSLSKRAVDDLILWECLVQARQDSLRWRRDAIDRAVLRLETALELLGSHVELLAALGRTHLQYREAGIDVSNAPVEAAESCAAKIMEIEPDSAAALHLRGWVHYSRGRVEEAIPDLEAALESQSNDPDILALLANCYLISGRGETARPLIRRLLLVDPLTPLNRCMPGWADALDGKFEAALGPYRSMYEMDPGNPMARMFYGYILMLNGKAAEIQRLCDEFPEELAATLPARITALFAGALGGAQAGHLERLDPDTTPLATATELFPRMIGQAYALAGIADFAARWLSIALARGFINYPYLARHDPGIRTLQHDKRIRNLLEQVRQRWAAFQNE